MAGKSRPRQDEPQLLTILKPVLGRIKIFLTWLGRPLYFLIFGFLLLTILFLRSLGHILVFLTRKLPAKITFPKIAIPLAPITLLLLALSLTFAFWFFVFRGLPKPDDLISRPRPLTTKIFDRNGKLLYKIFRSQNRTLIPLEEIPLHVRQATIAIEDAEFYYHPGFSVRGMIRAIGRNLAVGELSGGSTITQQLVKNALLSSEKTIRRKFKELVLSVLVEMRFSKDKILEMYLNEVAYGGAAYGIEEAAQLYFGKSARELSLAEGALLAGLPRAPTRYSPFGANPQNAFARQQLVLARMAEEGFITPQQAHDAAAQKLTFAPQKTDIAAPHFVMYVRQILVEKYGERVVEEGGLTVITSLELEIQGEVQKIVSQEVSRLGRLGVSNGAALVTNPATGEILAMVGSRDYFNQDIDGNFNVTLAARQPGSSIKPVNYSYALANGFTAASIISDTPVTYKIPGTDPYSPKNYDGRFHGRIPIRIALGSSYNVPAVKVLASFGVSKMIEQGQKMGITTWNNPSRFGLSLTLGGGEVRMVDMAEVFGTLATYGKRVDLQPILKITDGNGKMLEENGCRDCGEQVLDPRIAFLLTDILGDNSARTPAFGPNSLLVIPGHPEVAVKTGTSQNLRDNWADGYTKDFVVITWVGNNDNSQMSWVASGVTGATPIWHRIMGYLLAGKATQEWEVPEGLVHVPICTLTGTLPCEGCPVKSEWFLEGTQPTRACNLKEEIKKEKKEKEKEGQVLSDEEALEIILSQ